MINNSSLGKWKRVKEKSLNQQFLNEMTAGLNCSRFEATAILDTVYKVYKPYFDQSPNLKPGQLYFEAVSITAKPNVALSNCSMVTVILTLNDDDSDLEIRKKEGVEALRQHRLQRVTEEAFQQGGLLTLEDIAYRLFNCGIRTLSRDLKVLKDKGIVPPLRSIVKDMGRAISHRSLIIKEWLLGKEYSDISRKTNHSVLSVKNYVDKFKRTVMLMHEEQEINTISFLVKISRTLTEEYVAIYNQSKIIPHRKQQLESFLKKKEQSIKAKGGDNATSTRLSKTL